VEFEEDGGFRPTAPLVEVVAAVSSSGCGAIGLDDISVGAEGIDEAVALLHASGLHCTDVGVLRIGNPSLQASAKWLAGLAERTGAALCIGALYASPTDGDVVDELREASNVLSNVGVRLALEFAPYSPLDSLTATIELCERVGWERCGVLLDAWHFFMSGTPLAELRRLEPEQIALVHLSDAPEPETNDLRHESRFRRVTPGRGTLALGDFVEALREVGYEGVVSAEVLSAELRATPPTVGATALMDALRETWPLV